MLSRERELQSIENLLGEEFESLAQARRALKLETRPSKKQPSKPSERPSKKQLSKPSERPNKTSNKIPRKYSYTLSELKPQHISTLNKFLRDELTAEDLNKKLLHKNEYIAFRVTYGYTGEDLKQHEGQAYSVDLYDDFVSMFAKISSYRVMKDTRYREEWLRKLVIVRFGDQMTKLGANEFQVKSSFKRMKRFEREANTKRRRRVAHKINKLEKEVIRLRKLVSQHKKER